MSTLSQPILDAIEHAVARNSGGELPDEVLKEAFLSNARSGLEHGQSEQEVIVTLDRSGVHKLDIPPLDTTPPKT